MRKKKIDFFVFWRLITFKFKASDFGAGFSYESIASVKAAEIQAFLTLGKRNQRLY